MKRKFIKPIYRVVLQGVQTLHLRSYENYQPVIGRSADTPGSRDCEVRWNAMEPHLRQHGSKSLIDLGCAEGYYVLQAAKMGLGFCVGVDFDQRRALTSCNQVVLNDLQQAAFMISAVDEGLLDAMPVFDTVIFMSVLHHIMYTRGVEHSALLLKALHAKVGKFLVFEMGQSNEHRERWATQLPDMGDDPHAWIADFLRRAGFSEIEKIGLTSSYKGEVQRALFKAQP